MTQSTSSLKSSWQFFSPCLLLDLQFDTLASISNTQIKPSQNTSIICLGFSHLNLFTPCISSSQMLTPHHCKGSTVIQSCGLSFSMPLVLWMAVTLYVPLHHIAIRRIEIGRASCHKIVFSHAILIFSLFSLIQGGRGPQWMHKFSMQVLKQV